MKRDRLAKTESHTSQYERSIYLFVGVRFFVKSKKYYFDLDAVRVPHKCLDR